MLLRSSDANTSVLSIRLPPTYVKQRRCNTHTKTSSMLAVANPACAAIASLQPDQLQPEESVSARGALSAQEPTASLSQPTPAHAQSHLREHHPFSQRNPSLQQLQPKQLNANNNTTPDVERRRKNRTDRIFFSNYPGFWLTADEKMPIPSGGLRFPREFIGYNPGF